MSLARWASMILFTGALLLALGVLPLVVVGTLLPGANPVGLGLLFILVTPLGAAILAAGIIVWLVAWFRRLRASAAARAPRS